MRLRCVFSSDAARLHDPSLSGGALLDVGETVFFVFLLFNLRALNSAYPNGLNGNAGIYPVSLTSMVFGGGAPSKILAVRWPLAGLSCVLCVRDAHDCSHVSGSWPRGCPACFAAWLVC